MLNTDEGYNLQSSGAGLPITDDLTKFQALYDLAVAMTAGRGMDENLTLVVELCRKLLGADAASFAIRDETTGELHRHIFSGFRTEAFKTLGTPCRRGLGHQVAESGQGRIVEDYFQEVDPAQHDVVRAEGLLTGAAVPAKIGSLNLGVLYAFNRTRKPFSQPDLDTLSLLGNLAALEIERRMGQAQYMRLYETSRKSEELYRSVLNSSNDAIAIFDLQGAPQHVNPAFTRMFGWTKEEVIDSRMAVAPDFIRLISASPETKGGHGDISAGAVETRFVTKAETFLDISASVSCYNDHRGEVAGTLIICRDITVRKRYEEKLAAELNKFQALYDLAVAMTAEQSLDDNLTLVVESARKLLGADTASFSLVNETSGELHRHISSGFRTEAFKTLRVPCGRGLGRKVADSGQGRVVEEYLQEVDPSAHDMVRAEGLITGAAVPARIGRRSLGVLYTFNRTRAPFSRSDLDTLSLLGNLAAMEILRDQSEAALRRSEEQFRTIFSCAQDAIFVKGIDRRFRLVNDAMCELYGRNASEFVGHTIEEVLGRKSAKHREEIDFRVLSGETVEMERTMQAQGVTLTLLDTRVPLHDPGGLVFGICGILRNITERRKVDLSLEIPTKEYPSPAMRAVLSQARFAAAADGIILLQGESGSGKDYMARWIHDHSKRHDGPFFSINCAALTRELAESELFGHEPGAFTGAGRRKKGLLELAEGGTLLLNEIGELSLSLQAKLLTFLDTKSFLRVGGEKTIYINARILAATHRDLETEVTAGRFLKPLYYRLNVFDILVPPLRERVEDIPILVEDVLTRLATSMQLLEIPVIDPPVMRSLTKYHWPGNIRELRNVLERALMISSDRLKLFPEPSKTTPGSADWSYQIHFSPGQAIRKITAEVNESLCVEAIRRARGNKTKAASLLGVSRPQLYRLMEKFQIPSDS